MDAADEAHVAFFLTGSRQGEHLDPVEGLGLRPALFAGYRDSVELRYDFPVVLAEGGPDGPLVHSLSGLVDDALAATTDGDQGERIRRHALRIEREIRALAAAGAGGSLSTLWDQAAARLEPGAEPSFADSVRRVRAAIAVDGEVADCDATLPARLVRHAWSAVQAKKAAAFHSNLDRIMLKLSDILKADFERSIEGRDKARLKASMGAAFGDAFDFDALSKILATAQPGHVFPESRRRRIEHLLAVLGSQRFFPSLDDGAKPGGDGPPYDFVFGSCGEALEALRERMPALVELAKALAVAELEIDGQYSESRHDLLFAEFGANGLDPHDLAAFPDYLVSLNAGRAQATEQALLMESLCSGLPIKILLQVDDILEESAKGHGALASGRRNGQVASMAMGLNDVYVLQSPGSNLFRLRDQVVRGLSYRGPALFSVFSGASETSSDLPPYLVAAAAMESRAFPAFVYDPSAGPNWASRFSLAANPQADLDWPTQALVYEDEQHQRVSEDLAFTLVDFVAGDLRYARHLARVPRERWTGRLVPVDEALSRERTGLPDTVPSLLMVDGENGLHKVIADEPLIREARRCREMWHSLQELGGIHNSHADALLARERRAWERRQPAGEAPLSMPAVVGPEAPLTTLVAVVSSAPAGREPERSPDEAYIETARCSTCNECTTINSKMFAYNGNKQAYIADISAGTYAQLVEAAESCQVSVIHPGRPRNPQEAGVEELLKRAAPFL